MEQRCRKLSLRLGGAEPSPEDASEQVFRHAIEHQLCVRASYDGDEIIVAPHVLYIRHGERFVDAVLIERDGEKPAGLLLAAFRLSDLRQSAATSQTFAPFAGYDPDDVRYAQEVIKRLQR